MTRAPDGHLPHLLRGVAPRWFPGFLFLVSVFPGPFGFRPKRRFCSCFLSAFPCLVFSLSGWVGACLAFLLFPPFPPPFACLLHLASALATRCKEPWRLRPQWARPPPALGLARVASPVSCWESTAIRAEPRAGGVFGFIVTSSTTMTTTWLPRGGGIHPQQNPAVSSAPGFVGFFVLVLPLRCRFRV